MTLKQMIMFLLKCYLNLFLKLAFWLHFFRQSPAHPITTDGLNKQNYRQLHLQKKAESWNNNEMNACCPWEWSMNYLPEAGEIHSHATFLTHCFCPAEIFWPYLWMNDIFFDCFHGPTGTDYPYIMVAGRCKRAACREERKITSMSVAFSLILILLSYQRRNT